MPKATRDRITYPGGEGFPGIPWSFPSSDYRLRTQPLVEDILDDLGDLIDAIEGPDRRDYSHIEWSQLAGLRTAISQPSSPAAIADFVVDKANSISAAYCRAVRRRGEKKLFRIDLLACK
jgi:hypothetical protein